LALSTGEGNAALPNDSLAAVFKGFDKIMRLGGTGSDVPGICYA